jgi:hypothetical protein
MIRYVCNLPSYTVCAHSSQSSGPAVENANSDPRKLSGIPPASGALPSTGNAPTSQGLHNGESHDLSADGSVAEVRHEHRLWRSTFRDADNASLRCCIIT